MFKYFSSIFLLSAICLPVFGQPKKQPNPADTLQYKYLPSGLRIGTDVISIIKTKAGNQFTGWEINADIDFYRYYLTVDYGSWAKQLTIDNGTNKNNGFYENNGTYFRVGGDINFLLKDPDRNMFFLGFRIGHASFDQSLNYSMFYKGTYTAGPIPQTVAVSGVTAGWGELTSGLRVKIWSGLWMGYTARLKFAPSYKRSDSLIPYDIPGYGLSEQSTYWGFNYQVFWRFQVRKLKGKKVNTKDN